MPGIATGFRAPREKVLHNLDGIPGRNGPVGRPGSLNLETAIGSLARALKMLS